MLPRVCIAVFGAIVMSSPAFAQVQGPKPFGKTADGTPVETYTLKNRNGVTVKLMTLGATITEINVPTRPASSPTSSLASMTWRLSIRPGTSTSAAPSAASPIASPRASSRSTAREYKLAINNEPNHLHGGVKKSLDKVVWKAGLFRSAGDMTDRGVGFVYDSPDARRGIRARFFVMVKYSLSERTNLR